MSELKETVDWLGELLKTNFPECWTNGVTSSNSCANELLASWKREVGGIPEATCPDIDKAIKCVDQAMKSCKVAAKSTKCDPCDSCNNRCEAKDAAEYADEAESELSCVEDILEELRKDNQQLRELGEFWYEKCKQLLVRGV